MICTKTHKNSHNIWDSADSAVTGQRGNSILIKDKKQGNIFIQFLCICV